MKTKLFHASIIVIYLAVLLFSIFISFDTVERAVYYKSPTPTSTPTSTSTPTQTPTPTATPTPSLEWWQRYKPPLDPENSAPIHP